MSGIFPIAGVSAGSAVNASTAPVADGCEALFNASRCKPVFDPAAANAVISEIMELGRCSGVPYDCTLLDNLCRMIQQLIDNSLAVSRTQVFLANAPFEVPERVFTVEFELIGGAGAGGASGTGLSGSIAGNVGGGGGGGAYALKRLNGLAPGTIFSMVIGSGGVPSSTVGGNGGDTVIVGTGGPVVTAGGGTGGGFGTNTLSDVGIGGTAISADLDVPGGRGGPSGNNSATPSSSDLIRIPGRGGMAAGGLSTVSWGGTGGSGGGFGAGGNGASGGAALPGGAGRPGIIIARW